MRLFWREQPELNFAANIVSTNVKESFPKEYSDGFTKGLTTGLRISKSGT